MIRCARYRDGAIVFSGVGIAGRVANEGSSHAASRRTT